MNAVWSFWTKPYFAEQGSSWCSHWHAERHHWLAWGLSLYAAARYYPETTLVTDDEGARILVDALDLPFRHVFTTLNELEDEDPQWWSLGKIAAYCRQQSPFVHIDTDVFLWQSLPNRLEEADVFTQNAEPIIPGFSCYHPDELERAIGHGWIPEEWRAYRTAGTRAECCGVFGGNRLDFILHYARAAMRLVTDARNRRGLAALSSRNGHMILVEQYLLSACYEYHRERAGSPYRGVEMRYLFPAIEDAYRPECATQAGYTHLASGTKQDASVCADLEERVRHELPRYYERCMKYARGAARP
jgi:hypothetical protein